MPNFLLAILPPNKISNEIVALQKEIEAQFGAVHAQKVPPHITIIPPFEATESQIEDFAETFKVFLAKTVFANIKIHLDNFQRFESRTLFVDVAKNEAFEKLCKEIKLLFHQQKIIKQKMDKHFFVPHITLANKDLKKRSFNACWNLFTNREYQQQFKLYEFSILRQNGKHWKVHESIR
jgi:2'-5' RNA ligase